MDFTREETQKRVEELRPLRKRRYFPELAAVLSAVADYAEHATANQEIGKKRLRKVGLEELNIEYKRSKWLLENAAPRLLEGYNLPRWLE